MHKIIIEIIIFRMRKIIIKHWNIFQINLGLEETFESNPFVTYKRNKTYKKL